MKKLILLLFAISFTYIYAQDNLQNSQKYWSYRKKLKEKFIKFDSNDGVGSNMPVDAISSDKSMVSWGDGNGGLQYYIALLATEYRLLKNNGIDYAATRDELFHALMAFERLDYTAETYFTDCHGDKGAPSLNGFFIRDEAVGINGMSVPSTAIAEESKDNVWHYLLGLALVKALVDDNTLYFSKYENKNTTLSDMAKGITNRVISFMHGDGWTSCPYPSFGETCHAQWLDWKCLYDKWVIRNPVTFNQVGGSDGAAVIDEIPYLLNLYADVCGFQYGIAEAGNWIVEPKPIQIGNFSFTPTFHYDESEDDGDCFNNTADFCINPTNLTGMDFYSFSALYTVMGGHTDYLIKAKQSTSKYKYPHFVLIDYILHGNNIKVENPDFIYGYQTMLNSAPNCGPSFINDYYESKDWSTSNSLVWPEKKGVKPDWGSWYYSGIDYMLLYNLFWLVYDDCIYNNSSYSTAYSDVYSITHNYDIVSLSSPAVLPIVTANKAILLKHGFTTRFVPTFNASVKTSSFSDSKLNYSKIESPNIICANALKSAVVDEDANISTFSNSILVDTVNQIKLTSTELSKIKTPIDLILYPNPTKSRVYLRFSKDQCFQLYLSDAVGHLLYFNNYKFEQHVKLDLSSYKTGIYYLRITYADAIRSIKIIKE